MIMDEIKKRIADMTSGLDFERKSRATKKEKEDYAELKDSVTGIKRDIDKLSLRLWHACSKGDYHSLSIDEAKQALQQVKNTIEDIISK